ncbi:nucleotidyltransferase family protein [Dethiosulfatarculus sandiegensis]|uniref:MobA-like NTP transferase domain-containing protein n=1 Tax=Dethiosulfatarculus sandiegensis TaxID=1429043 RepID=A0A0D2GIJ7_9BACT|nr:nucleotidyltransferase family protein [Dethiosulfatarculus sandiegensis]KIX14637.1 hypothetical protein X474_07970 [Dethiosulfatarculus sandiegensis]
MTATSSNISNLHSQRLNASLAVILAAGEGRRFGSRKQFSLLRGKPLLSYSIQAAKISGLGKVMVVGGEPLPDAARLAADMGATDFVLNKNPEKGMGRSLALAAARAREMKVKCLVVLLADMPLVDPLVVAGVCEKTWQTNCGLAAAQVGTKWCHPVGFMAWHFSTLAACCRDKGARDLVKAHQDELGLVQAAGESIWDIDSQADLARAESYLAARELECFK